MPVRVAQSLGDSARLAEELAGLVLLDTGDAADLEQSDVRGQRERQGLAGLRKGREELDRPWSSLPTLGMCRLHYSKTHPHYSSAGKDRMSQHRPFHRH